jgi:hypothetical protein
MKRGLCDDERYVRQNHGLFLCHTGVEPEYGE